MDESIHFDEIKKGILYCIENANDLISDSKVLLDNLRYARSYTLSQLAVEEIGKAIMLQDVYDSLRSGNRHELDFKEFINNFKNHNFKTRESILADIITYIDCESKSKDSLAMGLSAELEKIKKGNYNFLKNKSLYVSLESNRFIKPKDVFGKEETIKFFKKCKKRVSIISERFKNRLEFHEKYGFDRENFSRNNDLSIFE